MRDPILVKILEDPFGAWASGNGSTIWDASLLLSKYVLSQIPKMNLAIAPRVIEFGSGLGVLSILLAKIGCRVIATERPLAIDLLLQNTSHNSFDNESQQLQVISLDWLDPNVSDIITQQGEFDLILGSFSGQ